jgi:hypothetical protein
LNRSRNSHSGIFDIHKQRIPRRLLLLDAVGAAFAAAGVLTLLEVEVPWFPEVGRAPGFMLLGLGTVLMLAVPAWLLRQHRNRGPRPRGGKNS